MMQLLHTPYFILFKFEKEQFNSIARNAIIYVIY